MSTNTECCYLLLQLRRECPLAQLMDSETDMVRQIRALDSDMQTLVYENYNKFISATGDPTGTHSSQSYTPEPPPRAEKNRA